MHGPNELPDDYINLEVAVLLYDHEQLFEGKVPAAVTQRVQCHDSKKLRSDSCVVYKVNMIHVCFSLKF